MGRVVLWASLGTVALGLAVATAIVVASLGTAPGAKMTLTGLPLVALPTGLSGATAAAAGGCGTGLARWERRAGFAAGGASALVFVPLVVLG